MAIRYRVYFTPLDSKAVYSDEVEVTDFIQSAGLKTIKRSIDSEDYDVGTFTFDDVDVKAINVNGIFNEPDDTRSIFKYSRDLCKVRIAAENDEMGTTVVYHGLINEEATKLDAGKDILSFRVLSRDSVLRKSQISGGTIASGTLASTALLNIFSDATISSVLTLAAEDIDLALDFTVEDGTFFDNKNVREALNSILIASGSVILIDDDGNVTIRDRTANLDTDILNLYGPFDFQRRQNVIQLKDYNTGLHRMVNSVSIGDSVVENTAYIETFGYRKKDFDLGFLVTVAAIEDVAEVIVDEFKAPKKECRVEVPITIARSANILDRVSLNWPLRITPSLGNRFIPIIGVTKIAEATEPLPDTSGSVSIDPVIAFKIIEIEEDPNNFTAFLKLRQIGNSVEDGFFTDDLTGIVGFGVIGIAIIGGTGSESYNPSAIGAAKIGVTEVVA